MVGFFSGGRAKHLLLVLMVPGSAASQKVFSKRSGGQAVGVLSRASEGIPGVGNKASIHVKSVLLQAETKPAPKASKGCPVIHEHRPHLIWEDITAWHERSCLGAAQGALTPSIPPSILNTVPTVPLQVWALRLPWSEGCSAAPCWHCLSPQAYFPTRFPN